MVAPGKSSPSGVKAFIAARHPPAGLARVEEGATPLRRLRMTVEATYQGELLGNISSTALPAPGSGSPTWRSSSMELSRAERPVAEPQLVRFAAKSALPAQHAKKIAVSDPALDVFGAKPALGHRPARTGQLPCAVNGCAERQVLKTTERIDRDESLDRPDRREEPACKVCFGTDLRAGAGRVLDCGAHEPAASDPVSRGPTH